MARKTRQQIFADYGIVSDKEGKHLYHPILGKLPLLIIDGNDKIGRRSKKWNTLGVWHFSTLPTTATFKGVINGIELEEKGTCPCTCMDKDGKITCYATKGYYSMYGYDNLVWRTWLIRNDLEFVKNALIAQIKADHIKLMRYHASGDFDSNEYIEMTKEVVKACPETTFWTYTKNIHAEHAFDEFENANIVKSFIPHFGFNYGHCDYILALYAYLKEKGYSVYICRCGAYDDQHCNNCTACSHNDYVLFLEHSTEYKAKEDPLFPQVKAIIDSQADQFLVKYKEH